MTSISKASLPVALHAAYDKAAKGVENDETRTNVKNDEINIDSEKELLIFDSEVENLKARKKLDNNSYNNVKKQIAAVQEEIKRIKNNAAEELRKNDSNKRNVVSHNKAARIDQWLMKNTPFIYAVTHILSPLKKYDGTEFLSFNDKTSEINNAMTASLNALW